MHYQRWRIHGDVNYERPAVNRGQTCSISECEKPAESRGWCTAHYLSWKRYGDPLAAKSWNPGPCSVEGCDLPSRARGWCTLHYASWNANGDPEASQRAAPREWVGCSVDGCARRAQQLYGVCGAHLKEQRDERRRRGDGLGTEEQRFWGKVDKDCPAPTFRPELGPCWSWTGAVHGKGYGHFTVRPTVVVKAHRWSYEHEVGPIPEGLWIDHLCRNTSCVRPSHLQAVEPLLNYYRGFGFAWASEWGPTCPCGTRFTSDNFVWVGTKSRRRVCTTCAQERPRTAS